MHPLPLSPFPDPPGAHSSGHREVASRGSWPCREGLPGYRGVLATPPLEPTQALGAGLQNNLWGHSPSQTQSPCLPSSTHMANFCGVWEVSLCCPSQWLSPCPTERAQSRCLAPAYRPIAVILLCKLPIVVVVKCGVGLDGFLLTQVLVLLFDAVHSSTGNLWARRKAGSVQAASCLRPEAWTLCIWTAL